MATLVAPESRNASDAIDACAFDTLTLDRLAVGEKAQIVAIDWTGLAEEEARRLRALGLDIGAVLSVAHRGVFAGRDPLAISIGRMTVALRRFHARAMRVVPL